MNREEDENSKTLHMLKSKYTYKYEHEETIKSSAMAQKFTYQASHPVLYHAYRAALYGQKHYKGTGKPLFSEQLLRHRIFVLEDDLIATNSPRLLFLLAQSLPASGHQVMHIPFGL